MDVVFVCVVLGDFVDLGLGLVDDVVDVVYDVS